eukprot:gb/GFBE01080338.1/.p1 GENE.gb/GFBE01080338.1/~~gb/GFBE01080338.1/.p1  ORF type:complete len:294 (+),score=39.10 gb/GFBE01080338.1/:1-882(+)
MEENPAPGAGYGNVVAYVAVPTGLMSRVLAEGYKTCRRNQVPCSFTPENAIDGLLKHNSWVNDITVLEVVGLPESRLDSGKVKIDGQQLEPRFLRAGTFRERVQRFEEVPCPFCNQLIPEMADERGHVGVRRYIDKAFACSPCCLEACSQRTQRLQTGLTITVYHQTTAAVAKSIANAGGKLLRGQAGIAGAGIYFAHSARETEWKCEPKDGSKRVVLECAVKVGNVKTLPREGDRNTTFASLVREGFDSVLLQRGTCMKPGKGFGKPSGDEVVVYSWDQVQVLREVPRDPVP